MFDLILLAGIVGMALLILGPAVRSAQIAADLEAATREARALYDALERFHERHRGYPPTGGAHRLQRDTLEPLRKRGYYRGHIVRRLVDARIDAYESPDDRGPDREFWVEMTLASDPSIRLLVAKSDDAPLGGGRWREGVFVYRNGELEPL